VSGTLVKDRARVAGLLSGQIPPTTPEDEAVIDFGDIYRKARPQERERRDRALIATQTGARYKPIVASNAPGLIIKERNHLNKMIAKYQDAERAVRTLGPKLATVAKYGMTGWAKGVAEAQLNDQEQAAQAALQRLVTEYAHANFGAALTAPEIGQLANSTGFNLSDGVNFFSSPSKIIGFMNSYGRLLTDQENLLDETLQQKVPD
jgi:hypothetical protein